LRIHGKQSQRGCFFVELLSQNPHMVPKGLETEILIGFTMLEMKKTKQE
jgi:hypothetical protein